MNPLRAILTRLLTASSRAAAADVFPHERILGRGQDWTPTTYAEYYTTSAAIYAAIRIRATALARAPLSVHQETPSPGLVQVPRNHPLQALLDNPNDHMTGADLIIATETNLCLWGRAHWSIETVNGQRTLWPLRPDRLAVLPGEGPTYIRGYLYRADTGQTVPYLPDEVITFPYFNPLQDRTGLSPVAPLRLSVDTAIDAMKHNRATFQNAGIPDIIITLLNEATKQQRDDFYNEWEVRFAKGNKKRRPALLSGVQDAKNLAFNPKDMEYTQVLNWGLEEVSRTYGVPQPMLGSLREATLANVESLERILWRMTLIPESNFLESIINNKLLPRLGWPHLRVRFNLADIDVLSELEEPRLKREQAYLDRGATTINEVRAARGMPPVPWGNDPDGPGRRIHQQLQLFGKDTEPSEEAQLQPAPPTSQSSAVAHAQRNGAHT